MLARVMFCPGSLEAQNRFIHSLDQQGKLGEVSFDPDKVWVGASLPHLGLICHVCWWNPALHSWSQMKETQVSYQR